MHETGADCSLNSSSLPLGPVASRLCYTVPTPFLHRCNSRFFLSFFFLFRASQFTFIRQIQYSVSIRFRGQLRLMGISSRPRESERSCGADCSFLSDRYCNSVEKPIFSLGILSSLINNRIAAGGAPFQLANPM